MKLDKFISEFKNIELKYKLQKFIIIVIGCVTLLNTFMLVKAINSHRTIIVPPVINMPIEITGTGLYDSYIKLMARYIMGLLLNYTPFTARVQFEELLSLYSPEALPEAKKNYYHMADNIESAKVTNTFHLSASNIVYDPIKRYIEVTGEKTQFMHEQKAKEIKETYVIEYKMDNGRFMVTRIHVKDDKGD